MLFSFVFSSFAFARLRILSCVTTFHPKLSRFCVLMTGFLFFYYVLGIFKVFLYISLIGCPRLLCLIHVYFCKYFRKL